VDYSKEEIALSLYYKELEATDCGIPVIGRAEKNVSRNSVLSNSKNDLCITNNSLRSENWLPLVDIFRTFYFNESKNIEDELETIKTNFVFVL
jgi:hypothetical protein